MLMTSPYAHGRGCDVHLKTTRNEIETIAQEQELVAAASSSVLAIKVRVRIRVRVTVRYSGSCFSCIDLHLIACQGYAWSVFPGPNIHEAIMCHTVISKYP